MSYVASAELSTSTYLQEGLAGDTGSGHPALLALADADKVTIVGTVLPADVSNSTLVISISFPDPILMNGSSNVG
jgi:hypothetical protein